MLLLRGLPPLPPGHAAGPLRLGAAVRGVAEGFAFLRTQPVLLMTFVVDIIAMTFAWPQAVFPQLSQTRFAALAQQPGLAVRRRLDRRAADGADVGLGDAGRPAGRRRAGAIAVWGVAIIGFGLAPALWLAVLCLAVAGAGDMVSAVLRTSMLQIAAPEGMRGRMQGVFIVVVAGGPRLGDLRAGALASATSVAGRDGVRGSGDRGRDGRRRRRRPLVLVVPGLPRAARPDPTQARACGDTVRSATSAS